MRFLGFLFFYETNPPGPLINRLTWVCWNIRFRGNIRKISDYAQANTERSKEIKFSKIQNCLTLRGVLPASLLSLHASPCLEREYNFFFFICELLQHRPTVFVSFLMGQIVKKFRLRAVLDCGESIFSNLKFEYLCEIEFVSKNILAW